jgi:hypothetical protein
MQQDMKKVGRRRSLRKQAGHFLRSLTGPMRLLPDFVIIGAQKCGTTTLYQHLAEHPNVLPASRKEVHFFDGRFGRGLNWYRGHFATRAARRIREWRREAPLLTGEASPLYLFHPHAARRLKAVLPGAKLIVVLRNPVDRAYSHYQRELRGGFEQLTFEEAIEREEERLRGERERMLADEFYRSYNYAHYSYKARGRYAEQLRAWFELFSREQFLILSNAELGRDPRATFERVHAFLGLPAWHPPEYTHHNAARYGKMNPATRARLLEYFRPHNRQLAELLGREFDWEH